MRCKDMVCDARHSTGTLMRCKDMVWMCCKDMEWTCVMDISGSDIGSMCWMYSIEHWPDVFGVATLARCVRWDARERLGICSMYSICSVISSMYSTGHAGKMCIAKMCIGKIGIGHMCIVSRRHLGFRFVLYCEDI